MRTNFSCLTCKHLHTEEWVESPIKKVVAYDCGAIEMIAKDSYELSIDPHFCALHTDRETVKRIMEGI